MRIVRPNVTSSRVSGKTLAIAFAISTLAWGCSQGNKLATYPLTVRVTDHKDQPLTEVNVMLRCAEHKLSASGLTGDDGSCAMTTYAKLGDGVVTGVHQAAVSKQVPAEDFTGKGRKPVVKSVIPVRYESPDTSGLEYTITKDGPKEITIKIPPR